MSATVLDAHRLQRPRQHPRGLPNPGNHAAKLAPAQPPRVAVQKAAHDRPRVGAHRPATADLLGAARVGNTEAWNELVARFGRLVWAVARGFNLQPAETEDISQNTWLRLVENLDAIKDPERLGSWLATTARREAMCVLRNRREVPDLENESPLVTGSEEEHPEEAALRTAEHETVRQALTTLPPRSRQVMELYAVGARIGAISDLLEISPSTVRVLIHRSLHTLRTALKEAWHAPA